MLTLAICETHTPLIAVATPTEVYRLWTEELNLPAMSFTISSAGPPQSRSE